MKIELPSGHKIGDDEPCFIVAEIGQNHQGDAYTALRLITAAHEAGVDAVKLCKRHIPSELTRAAYNAPYTGPQAFGPTYGKHREALELSIEEYAHLQERMRYNEYPEVFFATACDQKSVDELEEHIDPPVYKIASRDLDNLPLIEHVARLGKPVVLSTGMCGVGMIEAALCVIRKHHEMVILLHCVSKYPLDDHEAMLWVMREYWQTYGVLVGFSDHTRGIHLAQAAAQAGAVMIEKHITLSRSCPGTDHSNSLEPYGLGKMVRNIRSMERTIRKANGRLDDIPFDDIIVNRKKLGRSLVSTRDIRPGDTITEEMLCLKSPGDGIRWADRGRVVGKQARVLIPADVTIQKSDVMFAPDLAIYPGP